MTVREALGRRPSTSSAGASSRRASTPSCSLAQALGLSRIRALHPARPAADRAGARGGPRARRAARAARAARLRPRRVGVPEADAAHRRTCARPASGDGDPRRPLPRPLEGVAAPRVARRRHRKRRDRARDRATSGRTPSCRRRTSSSAALALARENAAAARARGRASLTATCSATCRGPFDLVVSNPPYVLPASSTTLEPELRDGAARGARRHGADRGARPRGARRARRGGSCSRSTRTRSRSPALLQELGYARGQDHA